MAAEPIPVDRMIVAVHQPNYLPYLGFFHKMSLSDTFVLYDTAQFSKNEFHNRNRIKTAKGGAWLTVPVRRAGTQAIREVEVDSTRSWADRHWRSIRTNYARAPSFEERAAEIEALYAKPWPRLEPLNRAFIGLLRKGFGLGTHVVLASDYGKLKGESASARLADLVQRVGGDTYLSGPGGPDYLDPTAFQGLTLLLQDFHHPTYPQLWGAFLPNLSAIDLLLNVGERAPSFLEGAGSTKPWAG